MNQFFLNICLESLEYIKDKNWVLSFENKKNRLKLEFGMYWFLFFFKACSFDIK